MKEHVRCTTTTRARISKIKQLVYGFRAAGEMRLFEIAALLAYSSSGARKYVHELVSDGVVQVAGFDPAPPGVRIGKTIYKLNASASIVDAFLERLDIAPQNLTQSRALVDHSAGPRMQKVQAEDGRQIHMLRDDVKHNPRSVKFRIPAPDPVLAAFYGFSGAVA